MYLVIPKKSIKNIKIKLKCKFVRNVYFSIGFVSKDNKYAFNAKKLCGFEEFLAFKSKPDLYLYINHFFSVKINRLNLCVPVMNSQWQLCSRKTGIKC